MTKRGNKLNNNILRIFGFVVVLIPFLFFIFQKVGLWFIISALIVTLISSFLFLVYDFKGMKFIYIIYIIQIIGGYRLVAGDEVLSFMKYLDSELFNDQTKWLIRVYVVFGATIIWTIIIKFWVVFLRPTSTRQQIEK